MSNTPQPAHSSQARSAIAATLLTMVVASLALLMLAMATGCASVKADEHFSDVQRDVSQRLDRRVVWNRGGAEGEAVRETTEKLLARPLDAGDAVQVALLNSNSLQATYEDLGVAQADLVQAGLLPNPNFDGFIRWFDVAPKGPNWNLGVHLPLQMFLIPLRKKLAGAALDEAVLRVTGEIIKQAADTRAAFYALQANEQVVEARKTVTELANVAGELAARQYKVGNVDDLTFASESAARQQANIELIAAENDVLVSRERLRQLMGMSGSTTGWRIEREAPLPPETDFAESDLVELAICSSLDVAAAQKSVQREEYALELAHKWWLATVTVGVETERASSGGYQTGPDFSVELPIFDQKQAVFARQEALIRQARRRLADTQDRVRYGVRTALNRMNSASRVARYYASDVVPLRQQMRVMVEKRYQGMLVGVYELLNAKSEEATAISAAVRARQDYWNAQSDLELAVGGRLPLHGHTTSRPTTEQGPNTTSELPATQPSQTMPDMPGMSKPDAK